MKLLKPFRGLRPPRGLASQVASPPYDVISRQEAIGLAKGNPLSFLHINKPEIDCPLEMSSHDQRVYSQGADNFKRFIEEGTLHQDESSCFYLYQQTFRGHKQLGLVAVASIDAYESNAIKKHELTRPEKEDDRVFHMDALNAQVGPVMLTYKANQSIDALFTELICNPAEYDFEATDGTRHTLWVVADAEHIAEIESIFATVSSLYIADGHHRSAAASRVRNMRREANSNHSGEESYNQFLVTVFPDNQMQILDYNRIVKDLNGLDASEFLEAVSQRFSIEKVGNKNDATPAGRTCFGIYVDDCWYRARVKEEVVESFSGDDPTAALDVNLLQECLLGPVLGILDQRLDKRVDFVGGIRGLKELERKVDGGEFAAAIALYPTSVESLMEVADANKVMPPKSTWFEPKLKSGLVTHLIS